MKRLYARTLAFLFLGLLMWAAFERGLFFDADFFPVHVLLDVLGLLAMLYLWVRGEVRTATSALSLWCIGAAYVLPLLFTRESVEATLDQVMRWTSYGAFFLLVYLFARRPENRRTLLLMLPLLGVFLAVGMFAGFYGAFRFEDLYVVSQDVRFTALGVRFSGFLQYANTFGAVMAAFFLYQLVALAKEKRPAVQLWLAAPLVMYGTALLLSESRGAWLMLTVGWLAGGFLLTAEERWKYVLYSLLLGAAVLVVDGNFAHEYAAQASSPGLVMLAGATVACSLLVMALGEAERRGPWLQRYRGWLCGACVVLLALAGVAAFAGAGALWQRGAQHFESAVARQLFYEDAWRMFLDSKWIGFGGESWRMLVGKYRQVPYVGNEVHSGLISIALDVGLIGLIVFVAALCQLLRRVVSAKATALPALIVLLGHSLFDVDLSFGFVWLLALSWIAVSIGGEEAAVRRAVTAWSNAWVRHGVTGGAMLLLMTSLVCAVHFERAQVAYDHAAQARSEAEAIADLKSAVGWNPFSTADRMELAQHLAKSTATQPEVLPLLQTGLREEPHNANLLRAVGEAYWAVDDSERMIASLEQALQYDRYDTHLYDVYLQRLQQLAQQRWLQGQHREAQALAQQVLAVYARQGQQADEVRQNKVRVNDLRFAVTPFASYEAAQADALLLRFDNAEEVLQMAAEAQGASPEVQKAATADLQELRLLVPKSYPGGFSMETVYEEYLTWQQAGGGAF